MSSFGEKLRRERESRNAAVEEIASSARIDPSYLEALERNEFEALPGGAFGKLYIRAYAEVLGFDPAGLIDDYDRERMSQTPDAQAEEDRPLRDRSAASRRARLERLVEPRREVEQPTGPTVEPLDPEIRKSLRLAREQLRKIRTDAPGAARPSTEEESARATPVDAADAEEAAVAGDGTAAPCDGDRTDADTGFDRPALAPAAIAGRLRLAVSPSRGAVAVLAAGLVILAVWLFAAFFGGAESDVAPVRSVSPAQPIAENPPVETSGPTVATDGEAVMAGDAAAREPDAEPGAPPVRAGSLTVQEFGVGRSVVNRRLVGKTDRFEAGSVAWFSTRVLGGEPGELIRHVWLHEGRTMQSISLELGGPHWRTHSRKTLGQAGEWAVEARDSDNRVLARSSFTCIPAGG